MDDQTPSPFYFVRRAFFAVGQFILMFYFGLLFALILDECILRTHWISTTFPSSIGPIFRVVYAPFIPIVKFIFGI